jgi:hypothetical protein
VNYCKVVKVDRELSMTCNEMWVLHHECGKIEKRRRYNGRIEIKPPIRVRCDKKEGSP